MKPYRKSLLTLILFFCSVTLFAQDKKTQAEGIIKQGTALHDAGKFADAIAKYDEALKIDPTNTGAMYEKAFSLNSMGKAEEGLPLLEIVIKENTEPGAYNLLGNIYDDKKDFDKAINYYTKGIAAFPKYQRLRFNLSISYLIQKKYPEAEAAAIEAIKLDRGHASSQRAYALAAFGQGKRDCSLLAWCSFLILEPQSQRAVEACNYVRYILNYGIKKTGDKAINLSVSQTDLGSPQLLMQMAVVTATDNKPGISAVDSLTLQLKSVFEALHQSKTTAAPAFYSSYYTTFFGALAASGNMPAFTRYITLSVYHTDDVDWLKAHPKEVKDLGDWLKVTKRETE